MGIGFVARWRLLVVGVRPSALEGREAYTTKAGERFYWIEDLIRRQRHPNGCEFIIGDLNGPWERCNAPREGLCYCRFHYNLCHLRVLDRESLLEIVLASIGPSPLSARKSSGPD